MLQRVRGLMDALKINYTMHFMINNYIDAALSQELSIISNSRVTIRDRIIFIHGLSTHASNRWERGFAITHSPKFY